MSAKLNLKKSNIIKRLKIPSISEMKYKDLLLNTLKEKEPEPSSNKKNLKLGLLKHSSVDLIINQPKEKKNKIDVHHLELKIEELENNQKLKEEEILKINNKYENEKNKVKKLLDIVAKKELIIDKLKKSLDKFEKQNEEKDCKSKESISNKLIKIDIINKKVEYNLNLENIHLKEEIKLINDENIKLMEELEKNKEIIINLTKKPEKNKDENISLNENKKENIGDKNNLKNVEKNLDINNEKINLLNVEITNLKEKNEEYKIEIKEKDNLIEQLREEINFYINEKENAELKMNEINKIHEILQSELEDIKKSIKEKEDFNNDIINNLKEEAIEAKIKFANSNYQNDIKYMKLKKHFDKLIETLDSIGIKVKDLK